MCVYFGAMMCAGGFGLGWAHDAFIVACHMLMHFSCVRTFHFLSVDINCVGGFLLVSLSLILSICNVSPLRPAILFIPGHLPLILPLLIFGFVMRKLVRTSQRDFLDEAFIRNAKSSYWIFLILTFPLSSTIGVGSHFVTYRSLVLPWSYRSFTPICTDSIIQYLTLSLTFEVCAFWSLRILYPRCSTSRG